MKAFPLMASEIAITLSRSESEVQFNRGLQAGRFSAQKGAAPRVPRTGLLSLQARCITRVKTHKKERLAAELRARHSLVRPMRFERTTPSVGG